MEFGTIPGVGKSVSRLVLGTMIISDGDPSPAGAEFPHLGLAGSLELLGRIVAAGRNAFDSAHVYGKDGASERGLGRWMTERGNRDTIVIVTKDRRRTLEPRAGQRGRGAVTGASGFLAGTRLNEYV